MYRRIIHNQEIPLHLRKFDHLIQNIFQEICMVIGIRRFVDFFAPPASFLSLELSNGIDFLKQILIRPFRYIYASLVS